MTRALITALRKELLEQWRTYRLLVTVAVLTVLGLTAPLMAKFTPDLIKMLPNGGAIAQLMPPPTAQEAVSQYLKNGAQFGVILALVLSMGAVAQEKEKGTAAMMLTKPLPRWIFLLAKFLALGFTFAIGTASAAAACYYYTALLFEPLAGGAWLGLNGLLWVYVLVYVALTLFASTVARSQAAAGGLAFGLLLVLGILGAVPPLARYLPGQLLAWGASLLAGQSQAFWAALGVSLGLIGLALAGSTLAFNRQEL